nr:arrestin domain-containing protein 5-like [Drosophila takahashii]
MRCSFELDRNDPIYFAGERIKGRALLTTKSTLSFYQIFILFVGEGKVRFRACDKGESAHVVFRGRQIFVDTQTNVIQSRTLPAGTHTVSFDISVPSDCPTSVVTEFGKIWYEIKLCILKVGAHNIHKFKKPLTVLQPSNLNMRPELLIPLIQEDIQDFCCWRCVSGSVLLTLTIPFGGYAPGQKIPFKLEVDNQSSRRDLVGMKMRLKQIFKLKANDPKHYSYKVEHFVAESYQKAKVLRLSKRIIEGTLTIPPVPPSSRNNNDIISAPFH